jgi:hypothetical protein
MWSIMAGSTIRAVSAILQALIQDPPKYILPMVAPPPQRIQYDLREIVVRN